MKSIIYSGYIQDLLNNLISNDYALNPIFLPNILKNSDHDNTLNQQYC